MSATTYPNYSPGLQGIVAGITGRSAHASTGQYRNDSQGRDECQCRSPQRDAHADAPRDTTAHCA